LEIRQESRITNIVIKKPYAQTGTQLNLNIAAYDAKVGTATTVLLRR